MFGKRGDGVRIKKLDAFYKIIPYIMKKRSDSQVFFEDKFYLDNVSEYIKRKKEEGVRVTHMDIMITAIGRLLIERPGINRFIMNRKIYQRNEAVISLAVKKKLSDEAVETTVKFNIKPESTLFDISKQISEITSENKKETKKNATDKLANFIMSFPNIIIKAIVAFITWLDNHDMLPKAIIDASPFHTSAFLTNVGSLGINAIYHHIYDFGTTSIFFAMGTKKIDREPDGNIRKYIDMKMVADERICDGLYYARSLALFKKYVENPELLEEPISSENNKKLKQEVLENI